MCASTEMNNILLQTHKSLVNTFVIKSNQTLSTQLYKMFIFSKHILSITWQCTSKAVFEEFVFIKNLYIRGKR